MTVAQGSCIVQCMETTARKCSHRVPMDRCPVHVREFAAAPVLVFDQDAQTALADLLAQEG
jgi:hypothetical protein